MSYELQLYLVINCAAFLVLFLIMMNWKRQRRLMLDDILFASFTVMAMIECVIDSIQWSVNGQPGELARQMNQWSLVLYFIFTELVCVTWFCYVDYKMNDNDHHLRKFGIWIALPCVAVCVCAVLSPFFHILFSVDKNNYYQRSPYGYWFQAIIGWGYNAMSVVLAGIHAYKIHPNTAKKSYFKYILLFAVLPLFGSVGQSFLIGVPLTWISISLSILIVFLNLQNNEISVDFLTGLNNRRQLQRYLENQIEEYRPGRDLSLVMVDVDNFKYINDFYGHVVGDEVLSEIGRIIRQTCYDRRDNVFSARYGGDEFLIVCTGHTIGQVEEIIKELEQGVKECSKESLRDELVISVGCIVYQPEMDYTMDQFIARVDNQMYINKKAKSELKN